MLYFVHSAICRLQLASQASPSWVDGKINVAKMRHMNAKVGALLRFKVCTAPACPHLPHCAVP